MIRSGLQDWREFHDCLRRHSLRFHGGSPPSRRMKNLLIAHFAAAALFHGISSAALVTYSFPGTTGAPIGPFSPENVAPGVNASNLTGTRMGTGDASGGVMTSFLTTTDASSPAYTFDGRGYEVGANTSENDISGPIDTATPSFFTFTITPTTDPILYTTLTLDFGWDLSSSVAINGTEMKYDLYYAIGAGALAEADSISSSPITGNNYAIRDDVSKDLSLIPAFAAPLSETVTFQLRFADNNSGSSEKRIFIDDINLNGTVVPEPSSALLLAGMAALPLLRRSRKR